MQIRFDCPTDGCVAIIELQPLEEAGDSIRCPRCEREHPIEIDEALRSRLEVNRCVVCRCQELFVRKDFPRHFGVAVVVVAGIISFATLKSHPLIAYGVLVAAALLDLGLYLLLGKVTACYACRAEYRGAKIQADCPGFDLATAEKY